jgi:hypothetical protein
MSKPIHIFKVGRHTAMNGRTIPFSEADLAATAEAYDPAKHEAPLVVGHPTLDAPAYGWVKSLFFAESGLQAVPDQVDEGFAELVGAGRFKHVSASFYAPDSPRNPVPGVYYLRHVGFLGAAAPAVKGLRPVSFGQAEEGVLEFGEDGRKASRLMRWLRDWLISKFGMEEADKALPGWMVENLAAEDRVPFAEDNPAGVPANKEETVKPEEAAAIKAENEALKKQSAEFAEAQKKRDAEEAERLAKENLAFAEGLVKDGRLSPAHKAVVAAALTGMADAAAVELGEGDKKEKKPLAEAFKEMLGQLPQMVRFGEVAGGVGAGADTVSFAAPPGFSVDADRLDTHAKALAYQAKNPNTDYLTAVKAVGGK